MANQATDRTLAGASRKQQKLKGGFRVQKPRILVIDDEVEIANLIEKYLLREGYSVRVVYNGNTALEAAQEYEPHLIILDILLPDANGIDICIRLRQLTTAPLLFLSCKDEEADKVLGLTVGADDYVTKPFSPGELMARVKANLRRAQIGGQSRSDELLRFDRLVINPISHTVSVDDVNLELTAKEFELLLFLVQHPNQVFSTEHLFHRLWGEHSLGDTRTVLVHISNLRKKIQPAPGYPEYIATVRGIGYKFRTQL